MARTSTVVQIDTRLVDEAAKALSAKSRTDAVHIALREVVALSRVKRLTKKHASKLNVAGHDR
jgi:Arc/MetJ family transcription regulator